MKKEIETKFYFYSQNNSGGSFDRDDKTGIGEQVSIEAVDHNHANQRAQELGIYFDGCDNGQDCPCCGDRWSEADESDGTATPSIWGTPIEKCTDGLFRKDIFVHYLDGTFKKITLNTQ